MLLFKSLLSFVGLERIHLTSMVVVEPFLFLLNSLLEVVILLKKLRHIELKFAIGLNQSLNLIVPVFKLVLLFFRLLVEFNCFILKRF